MEEIRAYYDGTAFVPIGICDLQQGDVVELTVKKMEKDRRIAQRLAEFERITKRLKELDETEPLTEEFYQSLEEGLRFRGDIGL